MLTARLFGGGNASFDGQPLVGFPTLQCHMLLCYLLLNRGRTHCRERLAALFWSEYPTTTSRTYLRTCLYRLRHALLDAGAPAGDYLRCEDGTLSFPNTGPYWLDVEAFETAVRACQDVPGVHLTPQQAGELERAAGLYTGDLLEGVYEDWCLYDRERLRLLHLALLSKLIEYYEQAGAYDLGLDYGHRILARDPTRERVHRQVMRLYWLLGCPGDALAQYRRCAQVLREEIGVAPTAKTRLLYELMISNRFDPSRWPVYSEDRLPQHLQEGVPAPAAQQVTECLRQLRRATQETISLLDRLESLIQSICGDAECAEPR
jgi:DNA-binding SARP family transcriptional activator